MVSGFAYLFPIQRAVALIIAVAFSASLFAESSPLARLSKKILDTVDSKRAIETVRLVYASDRTFTFPSFERTTKLLSNRLGESGLTNIETGGAPADGRTQAGFWTMPLAWDVTSATLDVISPERLRICDYQETPSCLGMWSGPTTADGLDAELVDLDSTGWSNVKGKLVLTHQNSANLKFKLVQFGALGAVNAFSENPELPDDRQWINAWGDNGWAFTKTSTPLLSYSISPAQAEHLFNLLQKGPVKLHAKADARFYEGKYPWITAAIPGLSSDEVLVLAHTSEQGAQDNATGVAASIEALHTLKKLIDSGQLAKPRRTIRLLLMPELYGSLHYIESHKSRIAKTVASITVDTPAASYELAGTEYTIYRAPHSGKSWTDALMPRIAQAVLPVRRPWHVAEYATGTDAYLSEPTVGVPNVWIYSGTGVVTHHNSADTPEKVDMRSMGDLIGMVATYLYYTAVAGENETSWLSDILLDAACQDLLATAATGANAIAAGDAKAASFALSRLDYIADRNIVAILKLNQLGAGEALLRTAMRRLHQFQELQKSRLLDAGVKPYGKPESPDGLIVRRKRIGSIPLDDLPVDKREGFPSGAWDRIVTFALYWCDGKRTISEVAYLTEMEIGHPLNFDFSSYFRFLERHGYVEIAN